MRPNPGKVSRCIRTGHHETLRATARAWHAGVDEIGAMEDGPRGALVGGNCRRCKSTIWRPVRIPMGDAPKLCECGRTYERCECRRLFCEQALLRGCL